MPAQVIALAGVVGAGSPGPGAAGGGSGSRNRHLDTGQGRLSVPPPPSCCTVQSRRTTGSPAAAAPRTRQPQTPCFLEALAAAALALPSSSGRHCVGLSSQYEVFVDAHGLIVAAPPSWLNRQKEKDPTISQPHAAAENVTRWELGEVITGGGRGALIGCFLRRGVADCECSLCRPAQHRTLASCMHMCRVAAKSRCH